MKRQKKLPPRNRSADPCPWSAARELHFWTFKDAFRAWSAILVLFYVLFHCEFKASSNRRLIFQDITSRYWQPSRSPQTWLIVAFGLQYNVKISSCHAGNLQLKVFSGLTTGLHLLHFPPCQTLEPHHMWSVATTALSTVSWWSLAAPCIMAMTCAQRNPICHTVHDMIEQMGKVGSRVREGNSPTILRPVCNSCQLDEDFVG